MKMSKKKENKLELKFCSLMCEYAEADGDVPSCMAFNPIKCNKYNTIVQKTQRCLDYKNDTRK